jgi:hypothetical protein
VEATDGFKGILKVSDCVAIVFGFFAKVLPSKVVPEKFSYKALVVG